MSSDTRVIVFGVDGLSLPLVDHLISQGRLVNLRRMFREGAVTKLLPYVSTWGAINWMSFMTGASPGTTWLGTVPVPGMDATTGGQKGAYGADTLWQALERSGGSSVAVAYPACWPPCVQRGIVVAPDRASTTMPAVELARPQCYMTSGLAERYKQPPGTRAGWIPVAHRGRSRPERPPLPALSLPADWLHVPVGQHLATTLSIIGTDGRVLADYGLLIRVDGARPDGALLCLGRDGSCALACLSLGVWSERLPVSGGEDGRSGYIRFKLLELSDGGREVAICHSQVYPDNAFAHPRGIEFGLMQAAGPYASGSSAQPRPSDPFWETGVEEAQYEADWLVSAAEHLSGLEDWRLFTTVYRPPDGANHGCLAFTDPDLPFYGGSDTEAAMEILARTYACVDRAIGRLMAAADDRTVLALASDHGAVVNHVTCDIYNLLIDHDLLSLTEDAQGYSVDWSRTQAYIRPTRSGSEVFVNLEGREPHGIVPTREYEALQRRLVELLLDWQEPESGHKVIAMALGKRDSALIGYWGEHAGDVQFIYNEGSVWGELPPGQSIARTTIPSVNHGPQIPTAEKGLGTNMGMLALWGPGIRKGYRRPVEMIGPAQMSDPAPTLAHILGCDPPLQSEGSVLRDMLE